MSKQLARTVTQGFNRQPAMIALAYANDLVDMIHQLSAANAKEENESSGDARANLLSAYGYETTAEHKPFAYADGIAFIPVTGLLINRFSWSWSWVTGYNFIREQMYAALADDDVKLIVFDCNSGGGMVAGCFELANEIYESRKVKPSVAVVDAASYSACYAIASSASKVIVTPSGGVGSIGVVAMHVDFSQMLKESGVKVTFIYSGSHKVDGNPYEPLPASVKADIQKSVDATREEFVALVSRNRGLDPEAVRSTEAACFSAAEALSLGLVDAIAAPLDAVRASLGELSGSEHRMETEPMSTANKSGSTASQAQTQTQTQAQTEQAQTEQAQTEQVQAAAPAPAEQAKGNTETATAEARRAERDRIAAIQSHEAAADKPKLAAHLALNTDMSVDEAAKVLAAAAPEAPEAKATTENSAFHQAMNKDKHPEVGAEPGDGGEKSLAQQILDSQAKATGVTHK